MEPAASCQSASTSSKTVLEKGAFGGQEHNSSGDVLFVCSYIWVSSKQYVAGGVQVSQVRFMFFLLPSTSSVYKALLITPKHVDVKLKLLLNLFVVMKIA